MWNSPEKKRQLLFNSKLKINRQLLATTNKQLLATANRQVLAIALFNISFTVPDRMILHSWQVHNYVLF